MQFELVKVVDNKVKFKRRYSGCLFTQIEFVLCVFVLARSYRDYACFLNRKTPLTIAKDSTENKKSQGNKTTALLTG